MQSNSWEVDLPHNIGPTGGRSVSEPAGTTATTRFRFLPAQNKRLIAAARAELARPCTSTCTPPSKGWTSTRDQLTKLAYEYLGSAVDDYLELLTRFDAAHPRDEPHYYLSLLGTHPDHRGKGIGMALLEHDLALIDADGFPAYLESSNPANNHRYAGVGFEEVGEFSYPGGDPLVTTMWRPAR